MPRLAKALIGCALVGLAWFGWRSWSGEQALHRQQLRDIALHAASAADAFRVLADHPDDQYERFRALSNTRSFIDESAAVVSGKRLEIVTAISEWQLPLPIQELVTGDYDDSHLAWFRLTSQKLFQVEKILGELTSPTLNRFVTRAEIAQALNDVTTVIMHAGE